MKHNGTDITAAYHNGEEITAIMLNGVDVGAFTPPAPPAPDYQPWDGYPDSPVLTADYPYQVIFDVNYNYPEYSNFLFVSKDKLSHSLVDSNSRHELRTSNDQIGGKRYDLIDGVWVFNSNTIAITYRVDYGILHETNSDIYTDATLTTVYFAKTTA